MRQNLGKKTILYPMPVLIIGTYDENQKPNAMNAAWGGISDTNQICICLSPEHKTVKNILLNKEFTVSIGEIKNVKESDYFGLVTGNKLDDKFAVSGCHQSKSELINAPIIEEYSLILECKLISYDEVSCHLFADILNVNVDSNILTDGKVDLNKFHPITFDPVNHKYVALGENVAEAFKIGLSIK